ncbi:MAG: SDR family NAD(P)-dependent oxidoreductase [Bryobacteraceae bacterium]
MTISKTEFSGKSILVTGAGRGLGKRFALAFARLGSRIALLARSKAELDLAHIEIEQAGGSAVRIRADVTDPEQLILAVERARVSFGRPVDILICAAASLGPLELFIDSPLKTWAKAIEANLFGVVNSCKAVLPDMIQRRSGKIIALGCEVDSAPSTSFSAYTTSKAAIARFTEALAAEVMDHNVQVNCFDPGPAYTSITDEIISARDRLQNRVAEAAEETRRNGGASPEAQLDHIKFLASEQSNHITGKLIHVTDDWKKLRSASVRPDVMTLRRVLR